MGGEVYLTSEEQRLVYSAVLDSIRKGMVDGEDRDREALGKVLKKLQPFRHPAAWMHNHELLKINVKDRGKTDEAR